KTHREGALQSQECLALPSQPSGGRGRALSQSAGQGAPRFHLHFTPTSASWLNMVERFFAEITQNRIRRGAFKSVAELKNAIMKYLESHNADPKPFIWTNSTAEILEKVARAWDRSLPARNCQYPNERVSSQGFDYFRRTIHPRKFSGGSA